MPDSIFKIMSPRNLLNTSEGTGSPNFLSRITKKFCGSFSTCSRAVIGSLYFILRYMDFRYSIGADRRTSEAYRHNASTNFSKKKR